MELTPEKLQDMLKGAVETGLATVTEKIDAKIDEKLAALNKPDKPADADATVEDTKDATVHAEAKDVKFMANGGYGEGKGALGMFLKDIIRASGPTGVMSERLRKWTAVNKPTMQEGDDEQGGYLVPSDLGAHLYATSLEGGIARANGAQIYNLRGNRITMSADVDSTHSGSFFGGVTIYRPAEAGVKTASKPTVRQIQLTLHKIVCLVDVTDELIEDSALAIEQYISQKCSAAIMFQEDSDFVNGTGVGMALGLLSAITPGGCVISVAAQPAQPANTIVWENIVDMWTALYSGSMNRAIWMVNPSTFPQLATMNMAVGAGGAPVWLPANGAAGSPYSTLMGRPVVFTEKCPTLGTVGDIILADWSQYAIAQKAGGIQTASSIHLYFNYDKQVFRFVLRYDGQPTWATPLTLADGVNTVSPFVVLATRP